MQYTIKPIPYFNYKTFVVFFEHLPKGVQIIGLEKTEDAQNLEDFSILKNVFTF